MDANIFQVQICLHLLTLNLMGFTLRLTLLDYCKMIVIIIHHCYWSAVGNMVVGLVCLSVLTYISITTGRNFLILYMMMGYDVGLMRVVSKCWYCLVSQTHRQKCFWKRFPCYKDTHQQTYIVPFYPCSHITHMAAHCKQWLQWLACCSIFQIKKK